MKYVSYRMIKQTSIGGKNGQKYYSDLSYSSKGGIMNMQQQMEERLWDYIDGLSSTTERSAIEQLIAENREWQIAYHELMDMHQSVQASEMDAPSMRFTKNVMEEIAKFQVAPATKNYINKNIIRSIGAFFLTMLTGCLVYFLGQLKGSEVGSSEPGIVSGTATKYTQTFQDNLGKINWGRFFNSPYMSIFMMINVVLALVLLDMYLQRKKLEGGPGPKEVA
ncbi:hypothetical protein ACX0G9_18425 [Flavitalea flava]